MDGGGSFGVAHGLASVPPANWREYPNGVPNPGTLIRLKPKPPSDLPTHPSLSSISTSADPASSRQDISAYASAALAEAHDFITAYLPMTAKAAKNKPSPPSTAEVALQSLEIEGLHLPRESRTRGAGAVEETWFMRTSVHENAAKAGTASWEEFDGGLRKSHSVHEMEYTPDVKDAHLALDWSDELEMHGRRVEGGWVDVHAEVREMLHHIPPPLDERVFAVLIITARRSSPSEEFLVVQIPVSTAGMPLEKDGYTPGIKYKDVGKVTEGRYVSIERGELTDEGVKWQMATASDAGGVLPMWAQKMGVPGAVVKDVGLFIDWTGEKRGGGM